MKYLAVLSFLFCQVSWAQTLPNDNYTETIALASPPVAIPNANTLTTGRYYLMNVSGYTVQTNVTCAAVPGTCSGVIRLLVSNDDVNYTSITDIETPFSEADPSYVLNVYAVHYPYVKVSVDMITETGDVEIILSVKKGL